MHRHKAKVSTAAASSSSTHVPGVCAQSEEHIIIFISITKAYMHRGLLLPSTSCKSLHSLHLMAQLLGRLCFEKMQHNFNTKRSGAGGRVGL